MMAHNREKPPTAAPAMTPTGAPDSESDVPVEVALGDEDADVDIPPTGG